MSLRAYQRIDDARPEVVGYQDAGCEECAGAESDHGGEDSTACQGTGSHRRRT